MKLFCIAMIVSVFMIVMGKAGFYAAFGCIITAFWGWELRKFSAN